jgi:hypothetical protein
MELHVSEPDDEKQLLLPDDLIFAGPDLTRSKPTGSPSMVLEGSGLGLL